MATVTCDLDITDGNETDATKKFKWAGKVTFDPATKNYSTADQFAADVKNGVFDIVASNGGVVPKGTKATLTIPSVATGGGSTAAFTLNATDIPSSDYLTGNNGEAGYLGYLDYTKSPTHHIKFTTPNIAAGVWIAKATYKTPGGTNTPVNAYSLNGGAATNLPTMQITEGTDKTVTFQFTATAGMNTIDITAVSGQIVEYSKIEFTKQ